MTSEIPVQEKYPLSLTVKFYETWTGKNFGQMSLCANKVTFTTNNDHNVGGPNTISGLKQPEFQRQ